MSKLCGPSAVYLTVGALHGVQLLLDKGDVVTNRFPLDDICVCVLWVVICQTLSEAGANYLGWVAASPCILMTVYMLVYTLSNLT